MAPIDVWFARSWKLRRLNARFNLTNYVVRMQYCPGKFGWRCYYRTAPKKACCLADNLLAMSVVRYTIGAKSYRKKVNCRSSMCLFGHRSFLYCHKSVQNKKPTNKQTTTTATNNGPQSPSLHVWGFRSSGVEYWLPLHVLIRLISYVHYENMPIQIYWKFYHQKMNIFR